MTNQRYFVEQYGPLSSDWAVIDRLAPANVAPEYEELDQLEAAVIAAILSDGIGPEWDTITADWRWLLLERLRAVEERLEEHDGDTSRHTYIDTDY